MKKILNVNRYKHIYSCTGLPRCLSGEEPPCQCRRCKRCGFSSVLGGCPGGGHGNWLQYSCLESSLGRGTWWATVHGITKSQTCLSDWMHRHRHRHTHTYTDTHTQVNPTHSNVTHTFTEYVSFHIFTWILFGRGRLCRIEMIFLSKFNPTNDIKQTSSKKSMLLLGVLNSVF